MDKKKLFMIVSIAILAIAIIGGASTYAWYIWSTDENSETKIVTNIGTAKVYYDGGSDIKDVVLKPTAYPFRDGIVKEITVSTDKETAYKISFNLYLDIISIDEGLKDVSFSYMLINEEQNEFVTGGDFSQESLNNNLVTCATNNTSHIVLINDETVTTTRQKYTLVIWIDGENFDNPSAMQGKTFNFKLHADGQNAVLGQETLVQHLTNKYLDNYPYFRDSSRYIPAYYAPDVSMMNDGMNSNHEWEDGENAGNIRYYGSNPSNYIDIGERDSEGNVIPWRIIGVFKNMKLADGSTDTLVKVVRNEGVFDTYGEQLAWNENRTNDWSTATLKTYLNEGEYYNGLSQEVKNKIAKVVWNLGGDKEYNDEDPFSLRDLYKFERGDAKCPTCTYETEWTGDIALMYPSDVLLSSDVLYADSWIYMNTDEWLLTPNSETDDDVWMIINGSNVYTVDDGDYGGVHGSMTVRPTLYLKSNLVRKSGDGSSAENAYVVE